MTLKIIDSTSPRQLTPPSELRQELRTNPVLRIDSVDNTVLATILNAKVEWLDRMKTEHPLAKFQSSLTQSNKSFVNALRVGKTRFILECKKASPSKGLICKDFDPAAIATVYDHYAAVISVLADEKFFQGSYHNIKIVSDIVHVPVLCKDFIYDPYQIFLARENGADAILLMLSILTDEAYTELRSIAESLGMSVLTEASKPEELDHAIKLGAPVIGINNRNLRNLSVDLNRVKELVRDVPNDRIIISESGIQSHSDILALTPYVKGFLIGSSLTAEKDIDFACRKIIYGTNKVCGITRTEDALAAWDAGAIYNGLIFAPKSPRYITKEKAQQIVQEVRAKGGRQKFVGVFVNASAEEIKQTVNTAALNVVQLHGNESMDFIRKLRTELPNSCQIWKAVPVVDSYPANEIDDYLSITDRIVLDRCSSDNYGGTGKTFNWQMIQANHRSHILVAGGLNPDNAAEASKISGADGLDFNSGVEITPGIKDPVKILKALTQLKYY